MIVACPEWHNSSIDCSVSLWPPDDVSLQAPQPPASGRCLQPRLRRAQSLHRPRDLPDLEADLLQVASDNLVTCFNVV